MLGHRCPVDPAEQAWIQESMQWFTTQFGDGPLTRPVILPTREFFPPPFAGSDEDVRAAVRRVAGYMGANVKAITVAFTSDLADDRERMRVLPVSRQVRGAAGLYQQRHGSGVLTIDRSSVADPAVLLAVIAHELAHARLTGEHRVSADRRDQEPLTDLLTVYLGMGIFTANAAFDFSHTGAPQARIGGWRANRLGYLTEQMFGYGLACYARLRGERGPGWARYLDTNPRVYMKRGLAYLGRVAPGGGLPVATPAG
jgi:hypothetical protein